MIGIKDQPTKTSLTLLWRLQQPQAAQAAWQELCCIYTPLVWSWAGQMGLQSSDRHDVVQDVWVRVHQNLKNFDRREEGSFRSWLKTITRNLTRDRYRRVLKAPNGTGGTDALKLWQELPDDTPEIGFVEDEEVERQTLRRHLGQELELTLAMNPKHQEVLRQLINGRTTQDVANDLGQSVGNVMQIWSRAKRKARKYLEGL